MRPRRPAPPAPASAPGRSGLGARPLRPRRPATDYLISGGLDRDQLVEPIGPVVRAPDLVGGSLSRYNPEKGSGRASGREFIAAVERAFS